MAAKDISDRQSLERWLKARRIEDAGVIAARAALYAVPGLGKLSNRLGSTTWAPGLILGVFRCCAVAYAAAAYPHRARDVTLAAYDAKKNAPHRSKTAPAAAIEALDAITSQLAGYDSLAAEASAGTAATAARAAPTPADVEAVWSRLRADAEQLEHGIAPDTLAALPLWLGKTPPWAARQWKELQTELRARSIEHWEVWLDWYEARLNGVLGNQDEEIARIREIKSLDWRDGPATANKKIKDIVARFRGSSAASAESASARSAAASPRPTTRLFVSHAAQADGAHASMLVRDLEAGGLRCWIAPRDVPSGADWNAAILSAIEACEAMILLVTDDALKSPFVKAEVQHAFERAKRVLPIRVAGSLELEQIDLRLKIVQHVDGRGEHQATVEGVLRALR